MPKTITKRTWIKVAFGDVVQLSRDRSKDPEADGLERYVGLEHIEPGDLRIRSWGHISDGTTFTNVFHPGQVLFGKRRAYQRKIAVADFSGVCSGDIYVLEPKNSTVLPELLPFICQTDAFFEHAIATSAGSLSPRTNWKSLSEYEFALPPVEEQRRITQALQAMEGTSESCLALLDSLRVVELSLFHELVRGSASTPTQLGEIMIGGAHNGCSAPPASTPTGHWVLALSAISEWGYRAGELKPVMKTAGMEAAILREGDLILSRSNTPELVGLPAVFPEARADVSYPDTMMRLVLDTKKARSRFVELSLRSPEGRRQVQSYAAGTSASMKKINGRNLKKVLLPLPYLKMQDGILSHAERFQDAQALVAKCLSALAFLKLRLLSDSFRKGGASG